MLVDDEESIVSSSKKILENYGYQISSFVDSLKALEEFKLHPQDFDLLISDKTMPKMDGLILSENILNIRSDIPIIICSGFNIVHNKENDTVGRISKYINKPITLYELLTSVREVLDN